MGLNLKLWNLHFNRLMLFPRYHLRQYQLPIQFYRTHTSSIIPLSLLPGVLISLEVEPLSPSSVGSYATKEHIEQLLRGDISCRESVLVKHKEISCSFVLVSSKTQGNIL